LSNTKCPSIDEIWVEHRYPTEENRDRGIDGEVPPYNFTDLNMGMGTNDNPMINTNKDSAGLSQSTFCEQLRGLLASGAHSDVVFLVGPGEDYDSDEMAEPSNVANSIPSSSSSSTSSALVESIPAHRAVLAARSEYFTAMFRGIIFLTMR